MQKLKNLFGYISYGLLTIYTLGLFVFTPYYTYKYIKETDSFFKYALLSGPVGVAKGLAWPYFVLKSEESFSIPEDCIQIGIDNIDFFIKAKFSDQTAQKFCSCAYESSSELDKKLDGLLFKIVNNPDNSTELISDATKQNPNTSKLLSQLPKIIKDCIKKAVKN